jgi:hypothetical protein
VKVETFHLLGQGQQASIFYIFSHWDHDLWDALNDNQHQHGGEEIYHLPKQMYYPRTTSPLSCDIPYAYYQASVPLNPQDKSYFIGTRMS